MTADSPASLFSRALLAALIHEGVRELVLCPGSRSQALALAAAEAEARGSLRLHVRIDERSAGFLALGLARESGRPVPIVVTSGTAVANLHPSVLEAHHAGVPLLVLSADRPEELRGIRSNQTTRQPGIFGASTRLSLDVAAPVPGEDHAARAADLAAEAVAAAAGAALSGPGPVQLNLAFREPLSSPLASSLDAEGRPSGEDTASEPAPASEPSPEAEPRPGRPAGAVVRAPRELPRGPRTVVIAGADAGPAAEELAHRGGWPLIAEISSGSRYGRALIVPYRRLLDDPEWGGRIERAIVFGHPTLSRQIPLLLAREGVEALVVAPQGDEVYSPGGRAVAVGAVSVAEGPADREWLGHWVRAARAIEAERSTDRAPDLAAAHSHDPATRLAYVRGEFAAVRAPITRRLLVESVWRATWPHDRLVFGASRLIREADDVLPGKKVTVHANRGLAGIDGTVSTALGIALASQRGGAGVTRAVIGDLTLLHDIGGMLPGAGEDLPRVQIVVGNDGGGTIFDGLEVAGTAAPALAERVLYTPQRVDLASIAAAYGWEHRVLRTRAELDQALTAPVTAPILLEVPLER